jgi:hypothetical protein
MKIASAILVFSLTCWSLVIAQQAPAFYQGDTVQVNWQEKVTPDLWGFRWYFVPDSGTVFHELIYQWDVSQDSCYNRDYILTNFHPGGWRIYVTAFDLANNESVASDPFLFTIAEKDLVPEKPSAVSMTSKSKKKSLTLSGSGRQ